MAQAWKYIAVLTGLLASGSQNVWALETPRSNNSDWDDTRQNSAEIPIESIEQFVQIYGIVKENYVAEKSDEELFLQATKGMVSGLDRYSRYLSAEDYKQLLQYTEADIATVDFQLSFDQHNHQWQIKNLKENSDAAKLGLNNGFTIFKIDNIELKNLNIEQVNNLLHGSIG